MQVFPHKAAADFAAGSYEKNFRIMSYLWLSRCPKAMIFEFSQDRKNATSISFDRGVGFFSANAIKRPRQTPAANAGQPVQRTKQDAWALEEETRKSLSQFQKLLGQIQEHVLAVAGEGATRLLIKHTRKRDRNVRVIVRPPELTIHLLSSTVADQLRRVDTSNSDDDGASSEHDGGSSDHDGGS